MSNKIDYLSASGIKTYKSCPKKYFYNYISDIEVPEEKTIEHFEIGNTVHDSIENVLQQDGCLDLSESQLLQSLKLEEEKMDYQYEDNSKVKTCLEFAAKYISAYVTSINTVEERMTMNQMGIDFSGYADLIGDVNDNGTVYENTIVDWKTGKENEEWKEKIQGGIYAKMFREMYGEWPESIHFVYLSEGSKSVHNRVNDGEVMWNDHQNKYWNEIKNHISNMTSDAYSDDFEAKPDSSQCYFCDYKFACSDYIGGEELTPESVDIGNIL